MHDEAIPDFRDMIEQMDIGLTFVKETFDIQPNVAWQIDPFGHGSTTAAIMPKLGFTFVIINRISAVEKEQMKKGNTEFYWLGNPTGDYNSGQGFMFSHLLYSHYSYKSFYHDNFNQRWDWFYYNVCVEAMYSKIILKMLGSTHTPVVPFLIGDDFAYSHPKAFETVKELMTVFETSKYPLYVNISQTLQYGTITEYIDTISAYKQAYGVYRGDFFPYLEQFPDKVDFWTGFYSTRPV